MNLENLSEWADLVYLPYGRVAHISVSGSQRYAAALCGRFPDLFSNWLGTGNQGEYDRAKRLPLCKDCEKAAEQYRRD